MASWSVIGRVWHRARLDYVRVEDHDKFVGLCLNGILGVHLEAILCHFERVTDRVLLHKEGLVELAGEENGRVVHDCVSLLDANYVINSSIVEDLTSKLAVASRNEHEFEAGDVHLEQVFQLLL